MLVARLTTRWTHGDQHTTARLKKTSFFPVSEAENEARLPSKMRITTLNEQVTYNATRTQHQQRHTEPPLSSLTTASNDMVTRSESNRSVSQPAASPINSHPGGWAGDEREGRVGGERESPVEASAVLHNVEHVHHRRVFGDNHFLEVLHLPRHRLRFLLSLRRLRTCWRC